MSCEREMKVIRRPMLTGIFVPFGVKFMSMSGISLFMLYFAYKKATYINWE